MQQTQDEIEILTKENRERINEEFGKVTETYKTNYETLKDSLKTILVSFKQDVDKRIDIHDKDLENTKKSIKSLEETAKNDLKLNEKSLKIDILKIKGELYLMKEWYGLALSAYVDHANLCVETNQTWLLEYIVTDIANTINKVIEKDHTITASDKLNIEKLLSEIPDFMSEKKKEIEENYKKIKIKNYNLFNRRLNRGGLSGLFGF